MSRRASARHSRKRSRPRPPGPPPRQTTRPARERRPAHDRPARPPQARHPKDGGSLGTAGGAQTSTIFDGVRVPRRPRQPWNTLTSPTQAKQAQRNVTSQGLPESRQPRESNASARGTATLQASRQRVQRLVESRGFFDRAGERWRRESHRPRSGLAIFEPRSRPETLPAPALHPAARAMKLSVIK
jgi:hypothetical protein